MGLIVVAADKGAPGVTTAAVALAAVWPRPVLLAECDPAGGDIVYRLPSADGARLDPQRGLLTLAVAARRGVGAEQVWEHVQKLRGGLDVLVGVTSAEQGVGLDLMWGQVGAALAALPQADVIADCGRLGADGRHYDLLARADAVVLVTRASLGDMVRLRDRVTVVDAAIRRRGGFPGRVGVVVVADHRHFAAAQAEVRQVLGSADCPAAVIGGLAYEPKSAQMLGGAWGGKLDRSLLIRTAREIAAKVSAQVSETRDLAPPALSSPALSSPALSSPALSSPALSSPAPSSPALSSPAPSSPAPPRPALSSSAPSWPASSGPPASEPAPMISAPPLAALPVSPHAPASRSAPGGPALNGQVPNGQGLNGQGLNGQALNGQALNGPVPNGRLPRPTALPAPPTHDTLPPGPGYGSGSPGPGYGPGSPGPASYGAAPQPPHPTRSHDAAPRTPERLADRPDRPDRLMSGPGRPGPDDRGRPSTSYDFPARDALTMPPRDASSMHPRDAMTMPPRDALVPPRDGLPPAMPPRDTVLRAVPPREPGEQAQAWREPEAAPAGRVRPASLRGVTSPDSDWPTGQLPRSPAPLPPDPREQARRGRHAGPAGPAGPAADPGGR